MFLLKEAYGDCFLNVDALSASDPDEKTSICPSPWIIAPLLITLPFSIEFNFFVTIDDRGKVGYCALLEKNKDFSELVYKM